MGNMSTSQIPPEEATEDVDLSSLFTRSFKMNGREIIRPLWFYISLNKNGYCSTKQLIIQHGGKVRAELGDGKTSKEICLVDPHAKASRDGRPAYSVDYIQRCIAAKCLLDIEDFQIPPTGKPRRSSARQQALAANQGKSIPKGNNQTGAKEHPNEIEGRDSEVTDDLPCVPDTVTVDEARSAPATTNPIEEPNQPKESMPRNASTMKSSQLSLKERRLSDWIMEEKEVKDVSSPLVPSIEDSVDWTKEDDNAITQLCMESKKIYQVKGKDPSMIFTLACWLRLERNDLLPPGRSAKACFSRAKSLWKNGEVESAGSAEKKGEQPVVAKRARRGAMKTARVEEDHEIEEDSNQLQAAAQPNGAEPVKLKNASRKETRQYIVDLVGRIARRGGVTKRNAFRALRAERGHWKRALQRVRRRRGASEA